MRRYGTSLLFTSSMKSFHLIAKLHLTRFHTQQVPVYKESVLASEYSFRSQTIKKMEESAQIDLLVKYLLKVIRKHNSHAKVATKLTLLVVDLMRVIRKCVSANEVCYICKGKWVFVSKIPASSKKERQKSRYLISLSGERTLEFRVPYEKREETKTRRNREEGFRRRRN